MKPATLIPATGSVRGSASRARPARLPYLLAEVLVGWIERARQRRALLRLDERMLKDIGVSRADAAHETEKPFWRP